MKGVSPLTRFLSGLSPGARRLVQYWMSLDARWVEVEHPRGGKGRFVRKGQGTSRESHNAGKGSEHHAFLSEPIPGLTQYNKKQIQNWGSAKSIVLYTGPKDLDGFIDRAMNDHQYHPKLYFGQVSKAVAENIKKATGIDVEGFNVALGADEIRKIVKKHGNDDKEALSGQRGITKEDFKALTSIIADADEILLDGEDYNGNPVIKFRKKLQTVTTAVTYASNTRKDLRLQTMYAQRK